MTTVTKRFDAEIMKHLSEKSYQQRTESIIEQLTESIMLAASRGEYKIEIHEGDIFQTDDRKNTIEQYFRERGFHCECFATTSCYRVVKISWE